MTNANRNRVLPHNLDAEASILGGVILRNSVLDRLDTLEPNDFYDHKHRAVFETMRNLQHRSQPIDVVTLEVALEKLGKLEAVGGIEFLGKIALFVPTADNVDHYAKIVQDKSLIRQLAVAAGDLVERAYERDLEADEYFGEALAKIGSLDRAKPDEAKPIGDLVKKRVRELEDLVRDRDAGKTVMTGVPSGIISFDAKVGGYPLGDLTILCGRPAMGKTAMAMSAVDATTAAGYGAHVFAQEGGWRMQADRAIARSTGIGMSRLRNAELTALDAPALADAMLKYHHRPKWLLDARASLSATDIIRCVRRHKDELGTKLVVVDYVQMLKWPKQFADDENAALAWIATEFARAANTDDICYLVLSQLNRKVEERNDKRPQMSDLRGSGGLEERPRMVVSPYRGSYYYPEPKIGIDYDCTCSAGTVKGYACKCSPTPDEFAKQAQVLIMKNNNGPSGSVIASWKAETAELY